MTKLTHTATDLFESVNVLVSADFAFFAFTWEINLEQPQTGILRCSLFYRPAKPPAPFGAVRAYLTDAGPWRCIAGGEPQRPFESIFMLHSHPQGAPDKWTARDLAAQDLTITAPARKPWLIEATSFHFNMTQVRAERWTALCPRSEFPE